jgi:hypothetical protein
VTCNVAEAYESGWLPEAQLVTVLVREVGHHPPSPVCGTRGQAGSVKSCKESLRSLQAARQKPVRMNAPPPSGLGWPVSAEAHLGFPLARKPMRRGERCLGTPVTTEGHALAENQGGDRYRAVMRQSLRGLTDTVVELAIPMGLLWVMVAATQFEPDQ